MRKPFRNRRSTFTCSAVVARLALVGARAVGAGAVELRELRAAVVARSVGHAGVGVEVRHQVDALAADVGDVGGEAVGQLALERDVPRVQRALVQPGRDHVVGRVEQRPG